MKLGRVARVGLLLCGVVLVAPWQPIANTSAAASVPAFAHVVVVVMENTSATSIIGNTSQAPYINTLAAQNSYSSNYFAVAHPSLPNYLALTGASTFGKTWRHTVRARVQPSA